MNDKWQYYAVTIMNILYERYLKFYVYESGILYTAFKSGSAWIFKPIVFLQTHFKNLIFINMFHSFRELYSYSKVKEK